jgi:hypothetical protein
MRVILQDLDARLLAVSHVSPDLDTRRLAVACLPGPGCVRLAEPGRVPSCRVILPDLDARRLANASSRWT